MSWLYVFLGRWMTGERWRKARPSEKRYDAAICFLLALYFSVGLLVMHLSSSFGPFMNRVSPIGLWLGFVTLASLLSFASVVWATRVPARISLVLAIIAWPILLCLVYYFEWMEH